MPARRLALALVAAGCLSAPAAAAAPQLHVVGNRLVDAATGQAFVPRGANWPSFEYACFYGYAYSDTQDGGSVNPDAAGAAVIVSWHINTVRIGLNQNCWLGVDGSPAFGTVDGYRAAVQQWVSTLHAAGLAVILDLHWSSPAGVPAEGQRAMPDDRSDDFWISVATTFKDDLSVMFDAFNEPYSRYADDGRPIFDLTWACWRNGGCRAPRVNDEHPVDGTTYLTLGMQQLVAAIRSTGARQPILVAGRNYANDLGEWLANRPADDQLVAAFHAYDSQDCNTPACWDASVAPVAAQVPIVTGEFGATDCKEDHLRRYMDWADAHGVGYIAWGWWVLRDQPTCDKLVLLSDPSGAPRAPNGTALKAHLAALAGQPNVPVDMTPRPGAVPSAPLSAARDTTAPALVLGGRRVQKLGRTIAVRVRCGEACTARAAGRLSVAARRKRSSYRLATVTAQLAAGRTRTLTLRLSSAARRASARALRRRGSATARITLTVEDTSRNTATARRTVRLGR